MGRGNGVARAAQARERLAAASAEQAEIAAQAIKAIEAGVDPAIAADLAMRAASEKETPEPAHSVPEVASQQHFAMVKLQRLGEAPGHVFVENVYAEGYGSYSATVGADGYVTVPEPVANTMITLGYRLAE